MLLEVFDGRMEGKILRGIGEDSPCLTVWQVWQVWAQTAATGKRQIETGVMRDEPAIRQITRENWQCEIWILKLEAM